MRQTVRSQPMDGGAGGISCARCYDKHGVSLATGAGVVVRAAAAEVRPYLRLPRPLPLVVSGAACRALPSHSAGLRAAGWCEGAASGVRPARTVFRPP